MEFAKDEVFQIRYDTTLNRLQVKEKTWKGIFYRKIKRHMLLTSMIIAFFIFATINLIMLYSFMKILQNV